MPGRTGDTVVRHIGHRAGGRYLARSLIEQGFDISYAYTIDQKPGCRTHSSMRCCCSTMIVRACPGRSCRSTSIATVLRQSPSAVPLLISMAPDRTNPIRLGHRLPAASILAPPLRVLARFTLARRRHGLVELVAFLPDRKAPLSLSRPHIRPGAFRGNARRPVGSLAGADYGAVGRCRAAGVAELGVRGWRDDGTRPTPVWTDLAETYIYGAPKAFAVFEAG